MRIGILALQGAVEPHKKKLLASGIEAVEVRYSQDLLGLSGIILPGGESTTMILLLKINSLWEPLKDFVREKPAWGACAGVILLAKSVISPSQQSLDVMNIVVKRNAYGRQNESFMAPIEPTRNWIGAEKLEGIFIRAPKITEMSDTTNVLFRFKEDPVMVEEGHLIATTFHPELTDSYRIHNYFIGKCKKYG